MLTIVATALDTLRRVGVSLGPGLSLAQLQDAERGAGVQFCPEQRDLLGYAVPQGDGWYDWSHATSAGLSRAVAAPTEGIVFDVLNNGFWPLSWGVRPSEQKHAEAIARRRLASLPRLVPLYRHRYLPAAPAPRPAPVFSVSQADVIGYGADLASWARIEFAGDRTTPMDGKYVDFWTALAQGEQL